MSLGLPYEWRPVGALSWYDMGREFNVGMLIPWAHKVYQLVEAREIPEDMWNESENRSMKSSRDSYIGRGVTIRPRRTLHKPMFYTFVPYPVPADPVEAGRQRKRDRLMWRGWIEESRLPMYPNEHFPVCGKCGEPCPCREVAVEAATTKEMKDSERYSDSTVCPACQEVVTSRQGKESFEVNLVVPGGPPVTFHTRKACAWPLDEYRRKLADGGYFSEQQTELTL